MTDHENRATLATELLDLLRALALECLVADREDFVDQQDLRFDVGGNRKSESHDHARREILDWCVDELFKTSELNDAVELGVDFLLRHAQD